MSPTGELKKLRLRAVQPLTPRSHGIRPQGNVTVKSVLWTAAHPSWARRQAGRNQRWLRLGHCS